jgi:iron complex outermembrane receptor protein
VLILLDGQRLNTDWAGGAGLYNSLLATENIERVEFIRGPGSALYGSNAFLGVVNIITARDLREAEVAAGSYEAQRGHLNWFWEKNDVRLNLFAKYFQDHGEKYSDAYDTINGGRSSTSDPRRGEDFYLSLSFRGLRINLRHSDRRGDDFYMAGFLSNRYNRFRQQQSFANLSYAWDWTEDFYSCLTLSYLYSDMLGKTQVTKERELLLVSFPPSAEPLFGKVPVEEAEPAISFHNHIKLSDNHDLQMGIEYRRPRIIDTVQSTNYDLQALFEGRLPIRHYDELRSTLPFGKHSTRRIWGLYAQHQFSPWEPLTITSGLRYDHYSDFGSATSLRLGVVYRAFELTTFKLLYGEAFRAPTRNETDFRNNPIWEGNPDLDPEESKTWELIWVQQFNRGNLALTYFHTRITDSISQERADESDNLRTRINSGDERSEGVELELAAELMEELTLRGAFTHLFNKPESGFREAKNLASLILNYHPGRWNVSLSSYYHGQRKMEVADAGRKRLEDYVILNCKVQYEVLAGLRLFGQVNNLVGTKYYTPSDADINERGVPNRGRHFLVGIQKQF